MKKNLGIIDRSIRIVLVIGLGIAAWYWSSYVLGIVALILLLEAIVGWCWLYQLIGIRSDETKSAEAEPAPSYGDVANRAVAAVGSGTAVLLDVRTQEEWDTGHAKDATHWPLDKLERGELPDVPKEKTIYTHCIAGGRATEAMNLLKEQGYADVSCMGGLSDWEKAGGAMAS